MVNKITEKMNTFDDLCDAQTVAEAYTMSRVVMVIDGRGAILGSGFIVLPTHFITASSIFTISLGKKKIHLQIGRDLGPRSVTEPIGNTPLFTLARVSN